MFNQQDTGMILLVGSALSGKSNELPQNFSLQNAYTSAIKHQIATIVYIGALNCGVKSTESIMEKLLCSSCHAISLSENQNMELSAIEDSFRQAGLDYMPFKGSVLKNLYPDENMRTMSDVDILIREEQYSKVSQMMLDLGYTQGDESDNEMHWFKGNVHVELHRRLFPSYDKALYQYFGTGWERAACCQGQSCRYELSAEDQLIFLFAHFVKHYRHGGIGIKHLCDLWVYKKANPNLDEAYVIREFKKLSFDRFYANVSDALQSFFEGTAPTEKALIIIKTVLNSGAFGTQENAEKAEVLRATDSKGKKGRMLWVLHSIFLPYRYMQVKYPFLKKAPFLLPVMWPVRWASAIILKPKKLKQHIQTAQNVSVEKVDAYREQLEAVGLTYRTKE